MNNETMRELNELRNARTSDRDSVSSSDSSFRVENVSRLSVIFDKARNKGRQLMYSHKNKKDIKDIDSLEGNNEVITVGQDALCANETEIDVQSRNSDETTKCSPSNKVSLTQSSSFLDWFHTCRGVDGESDRAVKLDQPWLFQPLIKKLQILPFLRFRVVCSLVLFAFSILFPGFISGFLWGLHISFMCFLYFFVSGPVSRNLSVSRNVALNISEELKDQKTPKNEVYKGWMNELRGRYDSSTYHVNNAQTVLVRLDGNLLRISRPERAVLKHAFHIDPTLTEAEPAISSQSIYNLTGATVTLRPKRLARRRWWSRKYPIHIRLASRNSEISGFSSLRRSFSMNEEIELAKSASSDDEECDSIEHQLARKKQRMRSSELVEIICGSTVEYISQESSDSESQCDLCTKSGQENLEVSLSGECDCGQGRNLYFFVRSAREKERWFHRLREACSQYSTKAAKVMVNLNDFFKFILRIYGMVSATTAQALNKCIDELLKIPHKTNEKRTLSDVIYMDLGRNKWNPGKADTDSQLVMSVNALAARIFYDFCRDVYWCKQVQDKIQSKLATLHLPYFIETLELSNLDFGTTPPEIIAVHSPILDDWGLWIDFELKYRGRIHLTLETKVNLMKLKGGIDKNGMRKEINKMKIPMRAHRYSDSDLPESPESSPDEDFGSKMEKASITKESTGKRLLNVVDKIASSNIFQGASELKPVKKMMEGISSTRLLLNVDVIRLEGTMTVNMPPPPSDRLWYAFRTPPELSIRSVPQVGDRLVDMSTVSSWIENKLRLLLEKNLVCPNMDDLIVPVMSGNELLNGGYNC
uniref:SMP-LTD domain-containing protein n=1 Tax=Setaria digitata TaxID=48799 RepID=A0A915PNS3_9BILA